MVETVGTGPAVGIELIVGDLVEAQILIEGAFLTVPSTDCVGIGVDMMLLGARTAADSYETVSYVTFTGGPTFTGGIVGSYGRGIPPSQGSYRSSSLQ